MTLAPAAHRRRAGLVLLGTALAAIVALFLHGPIPQDDAYHEFADARPWFGVPNGADVFSNVAFVVAGAFAFAALRRARRAATPPPRWSQVAFALFALGVLSTTVGSTIYHLHPTNPTLVFDRLPMSIGFATFATLVVGERLGDRVGRAMLAPAALLGAASVLVWAATLDDARGGDLRLYAFVQYFSIFTVVALLVLVPEPRATRRPLALACATYALAKVLEALDAPVLRATGFVSGHSLKHVVAALAAAYLVRWFTVSIENAAPRGPSGA
jgi:predicted membrane channel-forming protein YqfA (hemolysin III family)